MGKRKKGSLFDDFVKAGGDSISAGYNRGSRNVATGYKAGKGRKKK